MSVDLRRSLFGTCPMINKGERTELRSIVKGQFRVLRAEVQQRQAEMIADLEDEIAGRYAHQDSEWEGAQFKINQAVLACNRAINDALYEHGFKEKTGSEEQYVTNPRLSPPVKERQDLRRRAHARVEEQVRGALLRLDRDEADLLRTLAVGAIESDEAKAFLSNIPTVGELVPASRLAEITAGDNMDSDDA